jgi:threonine/homoserine/homoserine lactone efflux protein
MVGLLGSAILFWLAFDSIKAGEITVGDDTAVAGSITKAVITNLANPHPYIFWFTIGAPTALKALQNHVAALVGFVAGFGVAIVGTKMVIAYSVNRYRRSFAGPVYRWTMRLLAVMLVVLGVQFGMDGIRILLD